MTSDFKQVLEVRSENLKESKSRREQFSQGAVTKSLPQMNGYPSGGSVLAQAIQDDEASKNGQVNILVVLIQSDSVQTRFDIRLLSAR